LGEAGLTEDQQDVVGEPPARVLEEQADQLPDGGVKIGLGERLRNRLLAEIKKSGPGDRVSRPGRRCRTAAGRLA
jgi:hypothetical protein